MSMTIDLISSGDVGRWKVSKCIKSFWALDVLLLKDPVTENYCNDVNNLLQNGGSEHVKCLLQTELQIGTFFSSQSLWGELRSWKCSDFRLSHLKVIVLSGVQVCSQYTTCWQEDWSSSMLLLEFDIASTCTPRRYENSFLLRKINNHDPCDCFYCLKFLLNIGY